MSIKHLNWAFKQEVTTPGAKLVLVALADCADAKTGDTFAGQKHLAGMTSQSERTVRAHLSLLERNGYITRRLRRRKDGTRTSDLIILNADFSERQNSPLDKEQPATSGASTGKSASAQPAKLAGHYPSLDYPARYPSIASKEESLRVELGEENFERRDLPVGGDASSASDALASLYYELPPDERRLIQKHGSPAWDLAVAIEADQPGAGMPWLLDAAKEAAVHAHTDPHRTRVTMSKQNHTPGFRGPKQSANDPSRACADERE